MKPLNLKHAARLALMIFVIGAVALISVNAQQKLALKHAKARSTIGIGSLLQ